MKDKFFDGALLYSACLLFFCIPIGMSPAAISGSIFLVLWLSAGRMIRQRLYHAWTIPVVLLVLLHWAGLLYTNNLKNGLDFLAKNHYWLYAFALTAIPLQNRTSLLIKSFVYGASFSSVVSILQYFGIVPLKKGMPIAFFYWHQTYSLLLAFGLILSVFLVSSHGFVKKRLLYTALSVLILLAILVVPGRAGYLVLILSVPFISYIILGKRNFFRSVILFILITGVLLTSPVVRDRLSQGIDDIRQYRSGNIDTAIGWRFHLWKVSLQIVREHPFIGIGTGGFKDELRRYKPDPTLPDSSQPHNNFLYVMVSFGITGALILLWLYLILFRTGWRHKHTVEGYSVFFFTLVMFVGGMFDTQLVINGTGVMFALTAGLAGHLEGKSKMLHEPFSHDHHLKGFKKSWNEYKVRTR